MYLLVQHSKNRLEFPFSLSSESFPHFLSPTSVPLSSALICYPSAFVNPVPLGLPSALQVRTPPGVQGTMHAHWSQVLFRSCFSIRFRSADPNMNWRYAPIFPFILSWFPSILSLPASMFPSLLLFTRRSLGQLLLLFSDICRIAMHCLTVVIVSALPRLLLLFFFWLIRTAVVYCSLEVYKGR